jgi:hypothetical protein
VCSHILGAGVLAINRAGNYTGAAVFTGTPGTGKTAAALVIACDLASRRRHFVHRSTGAAFGEILVYMDFRGGEPRVDFAYERERDRTHFARLSGACQGLSDVASVIVIVTTNQDSTSSSAWHTCCCSYSLHGHGC